MTEDSRKPAHPESVFAQELRRLNLALDNLTRAYATIVEDHEAEVARLRAALMRKTVTDGDLARLVAMRLSGLVSKVTQQDVRAIVVTLACTDRQPRSGIELAKALDLPQATASTWVGLALKLGWVERVRSEDKRELRVVVTAKGLRMLRKEQRQTGGSDGVEADQEQDQA